MSAPSDEMLRSCIHCGLCLNSCPTYRVTGDELESPRGRLRLMSDQATLPDPAAVERGPLDRCLGCRNCETVCPSGVPYGALLEDARAQLGPASGGSDGRTHWLVRHVLRHPRRLAVAAKLGQLTATLPGAQRLPAPLRSLLDGLPRRPARWPRNPPGNPEARIAILAGCGQAVFGADVVPALLALAEAAGEPACVPSGQVCCGALSQHAGAVTDAREAARRTVEVMERFDRLLVPSAGCSAHLVQLGHLLRDDSEYADRAAALAERTVDAVVWLAERVDRFRLRPDRRTVAYHPPCHHTHAQRIVDPPLQLLAAVPDLSVRQAADPERCCGSAGSYSLAQPELAGAILTEKIEQLGRVAPDFVLTANPGCELFLEQGFASAGQEIPVGHLVVYLAGRLD